jgi:hypothetical protein
LCIIQELESRKRAPLYQKKQEEEAKAAAEKAKAAEERAAEAEARCKEARVRSTAPLNLTAPCSAVARLMLTMPFAQVMMTTVAERGTGACVLAQPLMLHTHPSGD